MNKISTQELIWGTYHIAEDEKDEGERTKGFIDILLSFIDPKLFKAYYQKQNAKEFVNEDFEREVKDKLGYSKDELYRMADQAEKEDGNIKPDIFGEPIILNG